MLRIITTLTALAGLAAAIGSNQPANADDDDDGHRVRRRIIIGPSFGPPYRPHYRYDDDDFDWDDRPRYYPRRPRPFLPGVNIFWRGGSVRVGGGRGVHVETYPVRPPRYRHDRHGHDHHGEIYVPPPPGRHDSHNGTDVPPPPAIDDSHHPQGRSEHTFPGPRLPGVHGGRGDDVPPPPVAQQPREEIVVPGIEAGQFIEGDVPLDPRVKVKDIDNAHPRSVRRIIAVRAPRGRGTAFVPILAPPGPPTKFETDDNGRKIELQWGDYKVEIESDDGRIEVEYDD